MKVKEDNVKEWKRYNFQEPIDANKLKSEKMRDQMLLNPERKRVEIKRIWWR